MRVGGGKAKGSSYEREICRTLSLWISNDVNENLLWRSAMSGGRSTIAGQKGRLNKEQAGDISAVGADGHAFIEKFYVECKAYASLGIAQFMTYKSCKLREFWDEALVNANKVGKTPLLITKQNYFPELLITTPVMWSHVAIKDDSGIVKVTHLPALNCQVLLFRDWIKLCKLSIFSEELLKSEVQP